MAEVILTKKDFEELVKEKFEATDMRWEGDDLIITVDIEEIETHHGKEGKKETSEDEMGYVDTDSYETSNTEENNSEGLDEDGYKDLSNPEPSEDESKTE
ncbi:hypothetical protein KY334_03160 [Candidatus Woesearchaeota archaeon]|nr:hypothetical protein [Candidatus Woesearchaeota archaeon]